MSVHARVMEPGSLEAWGDANERHLRAALHWLRIRLSRLAQMAAGGNGGGAFGDLGAAERELEAAESAQPSPALLILQRALGLTRFERAVLLLCAAMELDTRTAGLCAGAQGDPARAYPTFALALSLFDEPGWEALLPDRPLRYWRLIEIAQPAAEALVTSRLRIDERIVGYLKGVNYLDDRLTPLLSPVEAVAPPGDRPYPTSVETTVASIVDGMRSAMASRGPRARVIQLIGVDPSSKHLAGALATDRQGWRLYRLPAESIPQSPPDLETLGRLWEREALLLPIALYVDADDTDIGGSSDPAGSSLRRFLDRVPGPVLVGVRDVAPWLAGHSVIVEVEKPSPKEQRELWEAALGDGTPIPSALAGQFDLSLPDLRDALELAGPGLRVSEPTDLDRLWDACLAGARPRMDALAHRVEAKAAWDDIVLPDAETALLHQIAAQVRLRSHVYEEWGWRQRMNRGLGISALFAGESGTGKTMAAEVLARHLRLSLYRIDLSAVVSKYIGETEKNLRRLFDAAEGGGAILFFDEADALFGKRSEVKDSHDRYANIEINYLLQRMEAYRGLAILATNMKSALDTAFLRRLRFVVNFPFPGPAQRRAIWERSFPEATPAHDLDPDRLAQLNLTGGSIHGVALNAAFLAAQTGGPVTMRHVLDAARTEFRKLDRPINEADFV